MDAKDVAELMKFNPNFRELTEDDNYKTLYEAIYQICVAMNYTFESDMNSDSLEKIPERKY